MKQEITYFDIHTHILPDMDDGPADIEQAMQMIHMAYEQGTRDIIATPHYKADCCVNSFEKIMQAVKFLKEETERIFPDFHIHSGCEIFYNSDVPEELKAGKLINLANSRYVLIEFAPKCQYSYLKNSLYEIIQSNFRPILAHTERYDCLRSSINLVRELNNMGVCIQLNASALINELGFHVGLIYPKLIFTQLFCNKLLRQGLVHFIASDAHDIKMRNPCLNVCADYVGKKYGYDYAKQLLYDNAEKVLFNKQI